MGYRNKSLVTKDQTISSSSNCESLSDAMLVFTMNIIGLPVDVHVKDGSVFSGIFYTASVDDRFGIVLKQARMTKKGIGHSNVGKEALIDTLVVQSKDLVQVIAKGVTLPGDGDNGKITGEDEEAVTPKVCCSENRSVDAEQVNQSRQAGDNNSKGKADDCRQKFEFHSEKNDEKIQSLDSGHEIITCLGQVKADKANDQGSERSTSPDSTSTHSTLSEDLSEASHNIPAKIIEKSAPRGADCTRNAKEFKLNPAAKIFSPSFVYPISAPSAVPTAANMVYMPNSSPAPNMVYMPNSSPPVHVATLQPEVGFNNFASRPSVPVKVSQYGNLTVGNAGSGSQFSQPIVGQLAHRTQPLQYAAHYTPVLSEPAYLQSNSPAVMAGRSTQLVYVQQVSHDLVHGVTAPFPTRPLLNHVQFPKHQGGAFSQAIPVVMPPSVITSAQQQTFAFQNHIPVLQPGFSPPRPISIPGSNGFYGTKFS
ncbi:polyadenylate-binding protein-interacting protein 4 isoform X1 [Lathyrus oleraceus]|nr:polyadenylate-binding protein-interacting protein 4 isoform X1 [Pisum sativum]